MSEMSKEIDVESMNLLSTPSSQILYSIVFIMEDLGYTDSTVAADAILQNLLNSLNSGQFLSNLNALLSAAGVVAVYGSHVVTGSTATSLGFSVTVLKSSPTASPIPIKVTSSAFLNGLPQKGYVWFPITIIVGGFIFLLLCYLLCLRKKKEAYASPQYNDDDKLKGFETFDSRYYTFFILFPSSFFLAFLFFSLFYVSVFLVLLFFLVCLICCSVMYFRLFLFLIPFLLSLSLSPSLSSHPSSTHSSLSSSLSSSLFSSTFQLSPYISLSLHITYLIAYIHQYFSFFISVLFPTQRSSHIDIRDADKGRPKFFGSVEG